MTLKNIKTFEEGCYINLSKEDADKIIDRWDYKLNIGKGGEILTPKNISYSSRGLNRKGYWFKCLDNPEHDSELKNFSKGISKKIMRCKECHLLVIEQTYTNLNIKKYIINKENENICKISTRVKIPMKCPDCGYEKEMTISNLINQGFGCLKCSDGISYPEKFFYNVLEQLLDKDFQTQLSKTTFNWCGSYLYDFYINKINGICETHGEQHYKETNGNWGKSLKETQDNDRDKEYLAKENEIENYLVINCRYSTIEWIKNSIMNRDITRPDQPCLAELLNFVESDIDWLKCHEVGCKSLVKEVCLLWENKGLNMLEIAKELKIGTETIRKYLIQGTELGWCNYKIKTDRIKQVICLTTGEVFNNQKDAYDKYDICASSVSQCCNNKREFAGKHPETNEKMVWMYYNKYIENKNLLPCIN